METGRSLADRCREHRLDVEYKKSDLLAAQQFNSPGHSLEDFGAAELKSRLAKKDVRQHEVMRQIFKFQTLVPHDINCDLSFINIPKHPEEGSNAKRRLIYTVIKRRFNNIFSI